MTVRADWRNLNDSTSKTLEEELAKLLSVKENLTGFKVRHYKTSSMVEVIELISGKDYLESTRGYLIVKGENVQELHNQVYSKLEAKIGEAKTIHGEGPRVSGTLWSKPQDRSDWVYLETDGICVRVPETAS